MEIFILCLLVLVAGVNLVLAVSTSLVLIKIFEVVKMQQYTQEREEDVKRQARGLINVDTPQIPYNLRP